MNLIDFAVETGIDRERAEAAVATFDEMFVGNEFVAARRGNVVHLAVRVRGLGGRRVLAQCRDLLQEWFKLYAVLLAGVRHGNPRARKIAERLGFKAYAETATHVWLAKERGHE